MSMEQNFDKIEKIPNEIISSLDPLDLDIFMLELPVINKAQNTSLLISTLDYAVKASQLSVKDTDNLNALASLRDIDFILSSLLRCGIDVLDTIPQLENELKRLAIASGTIPRGSVFTYATVNPRGTRQRSFTGTAEEDVFIEAVRQSYAALDNALLDFRALPTKFNDIELNETLLSTTDAVQVMTTSIITVSRTVSPTFFSNEMRPYFEPLTIEGEVFTGAGGAQMQLLAIDRAVWGLESKNEPYNTFYTENLKYLTPVQGEALEGYIKAHGGRSIVEYIESSPQEFTKSVTTAINLLSQIKKFRYPHRKIANDNFKLRDNKAVGSGQYKPDILDVLIAETEDALKRLVRVVENEK